MGLGCGQAAEDRALGDDPGHRKSPPSWGYGTWRTGARNCLANTSTAVSHVGKETSVPAQAPFHPTQPAGAGRREGEAPGVKEGAQMTGTFSTVPQSCGAGFWPSSDPQILTQDQAVICSWSGCCFLRGRGHKLEAQGPELGPWVSFVRPTWNFLLNGVNI